MSCRAATGHVFHDLDFTVVAAPGFAPCRRCGRLVTQSQFLDESCGGTPHEPDGRQGEPVCALCGEPLTVDPMHLGTVQLFGSTCASCFGMVETIGGAA